MVSSGTGLNWDEVRPQRGAKITVDSSGGSAISNRLGTPTWLVGQGGTFELIGGPNVITETFTNIATGAGGFANQTQNGGLGFVSVTPGAGITTLAVGALENFQSAGQRIATTVLRSPSMSNLPGTYDTAGVFIPNGGNTLNGLIQVTTPNFRNNTAYGVGPGGNIVGESGTPAVATRGDILGDTNTVSGGWHRCDRRHRRAGIVSAASEYSSTFRDNQSNTLNVKLSGTTSISGDTQVQTVTLTSGSTLNILAFSAQCSASRLQINAAGVSLRPVRPRRSTAPPKCP